MPEDQLDTHKRRLDRRSGQILIMFTLALIPMFGIMGLVTDLGYMHFVKMSAQTAAEAAASAAIVDMRVRGTAGLTFSTTSTSCTPGITTPANAFERGCMYAQQHGFNSANQVTYQSGTTGTPPTASGIGTASYWVTYRVSQQVPQLFSAVLGNTSGQVVARSSAALKGASDCMFALNPSAPGAFSVGGSSSM